MNNFIEGIKLHYRRRKHYKVRFDKNHIWFYNRWSQKYISRNGSYTIIGFSINYFSNTQFEYRISFFGFDIRIFLIRIYND